MKLVKKGFVVCEGCGAEVNQAVLFVRAEVFDNSSNLLEPAPTQVPYCLGCASELLAGAPPPEPYPHGN